MRSTLFVRLFAVFLAAFEPTEADASKKDLVKLQGDWAIVSYVIDGKKLSDDEAQSLFRTFKKDECTVYLFDKPLAKGKIRIDANKKPKTIDICPAESPDKPRLGIYEIEGDTLKICMASPGKERPKEFSSKKDSGQSLEVSEREKKR
jgi:uncharacterized protein (TIGR03067 family)